MTVQGDARRGNGPVILTKIKVVANFAPFEVNANNPLNSDIWVSVMESPQDLCWNFCGWDFVPVYILVSANAST
jgi:hypothetical protein